MPISSLRIPTIFGLGIDSVLPTCFVEKVTCRYGASPNPRQNMRRVLLCMMVGLVVAAGSFHRIDMSSAQPGNSKAESSSATIKGTVTYNGDEKPSLLYMKPNKHQEDCPEQIPSGGWDVNQENRGVRNCIVFLEYPKAQSPQTKKQNEKGAPRTDSSKKVTLKVTKCQYQPRVVCVLPDEELEVVNECNFPIDVRLKGGVTQTGLWNLPKKGTLKIPVTACDKSPVELDCSCCVWMKAFVWKAATAHAAAVTDGDGGFTIRDVPVEGTQPILWVWHEMLPGDHLKRIGPVEASSGKTVELKIAIPK